MNLKTTTRKVFAVGARASEMPIEQPPDELPAGASVSPPHTRKMRRKMFRRLPTCFVPGLAPICCDTADPDTVNCAFRKRLLRKLPVPDASMIAEFKEFVTRWVASLPRATPLPFEEWLAGTSYNEARKAELRLAHEALRGGRPDLHACQRVKSFVKTESYPEYKHARMINSRIDAFKVFSGPIFKAIENVVYALPYFVKHVPVADRSKLVLGLKQAGRRYYATDFTAYESHFTREFMKAAEIAVYKHVMSSIPDDIDFVCRVISGSNHMSTHMGFKATCIARRMSGEMCTSLGNGLANILLALFLADRQGKAIDGFVEGDDGLFSTEAVLTAEDYARLGFTIKIEEVADPCTASFCGMIFSESGEIIRDPTHFCTTFGWTSSFIGAGPKIMNELLRAKALSAVYETPQCPIVGALARRALRDTEGYAPRFINDGYHCPPDEVKLPPFCPSQDTRELMRIKFGIPPDVQEHVEDMIGRGDFDIAEFLCPHPHVLHYAARYVEPT